MTTTHEVTHVLSGLKADIEFPDDDPREELPVAAVVTVRAPRGASVFHLAAAISRAGTDCHRLKREAKE